jgi:LacI family repressor for deo operon, udp, cdd, tsx, nupC, and nupG
MARDGADTMTGRGGPTSAVTIYDVAGAAGVAPSTVSRTFSRPGRVSSETAERVRGAAERLGYRANPIARALSTSRTRMIALVVSDITNPFYSGIVRGAQEAAGRAGYTVLLVDTRESDQRERAAVERAMPAVDGILLASSRMSDSAIRMMSKQKPVVVLNRAVVDVPCVVTDIPRGMRRAVEHLGELGHDHITYLAGPEASWADGMRWRSLRESALDLELKVRRIGPFAPDVDGGGRAVAEYLESPTSAAIAYNDQIAIGFMRGLRAVGVQVPRETSVIGFDNIVAADLVTPALTTVAAPLHTEGSTATIHLMAMIDGVVAHTGGPVVLPTRLVVRESTAQRRRKSTSPAFGTTNVSSSASNAATSTADGSR